jgi:hypothetical protein
MLNKMNRTDSNKKATRSNKGNYDTDIDNYEKLLNDLENYPELIEGNLRDMYYGKTSVEDMYREDVCDSLLDLVDKKIQNI